MPYFAHGTEHQRVVGVRLLRWRAPRGGEKLAFACRRIEVIPGVEVRRAGVIQRRAWPLHMSHIAHFLVRHAVKERAEFAHFVPDLLVVVVMHRVAHRGGDKADDFPVAFDVVFRRNGRLKALETAVGAGKDAAMFAPGGGR